MAMHLGTVHKIRPTSRGGGGSAQKLSTYFMDRTIGKIFENLMKFGQILQKITKFTTIEQRKAKCPQKLGFKTLMCYKYHHYL